MTALLGGLEHFAYLCHLLLSAQQITVLSLLGALPEKPEPAVAYKAIMRYLSQMLLRLPAQARDTEARSDEYDLGLWAVRWKMIFTWQVPMMFTGYAFLCYIVGLSILVCSPLLLDEPWRPNSNIAVAYLAVLAVGWAIFIYCSLMGYEDIELDIETRTESSNAVVSNIHTVSLKDEGSSGRSAM